jgi:hypothetical protein
MVIYAEPSSHILAYTHMHIRTYALTTLVEGFRRVGAADRILLLSLDIVSVGG